MSKEWFIKEGGQVCFKSDNAELNGWDIQSLVDCLNGKETKIADLEAKLAELREQITILDEENSKTFMKSVNAWRENAELKQQLAESEEKYNATNRAYWELVEKQDNDFLQYEKLIGENQQLKQQLEDLENDHNKLIEQYDNQYNDLCKEIKVHSSARERFVKKVEELKQQVAEKDNQIETLEQEVEHLKSCLEFAKEQVNRDKISFAVERLEKVKEEIDLRPRGVSKGWKNKEYDTLVEEDVYEVIENQIKQLKDVK